MDKSPLKTLTLEDFLESERHKLTGTLTPVTPETFAKWKKERLDKKAAEAEAQKAKDATGKALFESGDWKGSDEDTDDDDEDDDDGRWNLEAMRRETERLREQREQERLDKMHGEPLPASNSIDGSVNDDGNDDGGGSDSDSDSDSDSSGEESNGEGGSGES
jgi:DRG Family Regulatory Proteins, Tma46